MSEKKKPTEGRFHDRIHDERTNPCVAEIHLVQQCFNDFDHDKNKCELYIKNYKNCKDFWNRVWRERSLQNVKPFLPAIEDRPKIKDEYRQKWKV